MGSFRRHWSMMSGLMDTIKVDASFKRPEEYSFSHSATPLEGV